MRYCQIRLQLSLQTSTILKVEPHRWVAIITSSAYMSKKILVVDDNPQLRSLLQSYLSQEIFNVSTARDGQEALFMARREKPDLIILDLMMPGMSGYEFLRTYN